MKFTNLASCTQGIAAFEWENENKFVQSCGEVLGTEEFYVLTRISALEVSAR